MAKLNAYGQREVFRIARERDLPNDPFVSWERIERAIMHNGRILEKRTVLFRDSLYGPYRHAWGWKLHARLKPGWTPRAFVDLLLAPRKDGSASPWELTKGTLENV